MTTSADADAVGSMARRIQLWLAALRADIEDSSQRFKDGGDVAAGAFLSVLIDILGEHESAFKRYEAATTAPVPDRFRWFQTIGAELSVLVYYLETLDGALAPRLTPLVAAFERILQNLLPGHPAVFRSFRAFNYELSAIHAEGFRSALGDRLEKHSWPALWG